MDSSDNNNNSNISNHSSQKQKYINNNLNHYQVKGVLGNGSFGKVKLAVHKKTNEEVAIKIIEKNCEKNIQISKDEISILNEISHPNIMKVYEIIETEKAFNIVTEYLSGGELFQYIEKKTRLCQNEIAFFFFQIVNAVHYLHSHNIVHRDLKPENILITKTKILKIIDFGLAKRVIKHNLLATKCGSLCYSPPEVLKGIKYDGEFVDIWSIGIIVFAMACGTLPFEDKKEDVLIKKIMGGKIEYPHYLPFVVKNLIQKILVINPNKRMTIKEMREHSLYHHGKIIFLRENSIYDEIHFNIKDTIAKRADDLVHQKFNVEDGQNEEEQNEIRISQKIYLEVVLRETNWKVYDNQLTDDTQSYKNSSSSQNFNISNNNMKEATTNNVEPKKGRTEKREKLLSPKTIKKKIQKLNLVDTFSSAFPMKRAYSNSSLSKDTDKFLTSFQRIKSKLNQDEVDSKKINTLENVSGSGHNTRRPVTLSKIKDFRKKNFNTYRSENELCRHLTKPPKYQCINLSEVEKINPIINMDNPKPEKKSNKTEKQENYKGEKGDKEKQERTEKAESKIDRNSRSDKKIKIELIPKTDKSLIKEGKNNKEAKQRDIKEFTRNVAREFNKNPLKDITKDITKEINKINKDICCRSNKELKDTKFVKETTFSKARKDSRERKQKKNIRKESKGASETKKEENKNEGGIEDYKTETRQDDLVKQKKDMIEKKIKLEKTEKLIKLEKFDKKKPPIPKMQSSPKLNSGGPFHTNKRAVNSITNNSNNNLDPSQDLGEIFIYLKKKYYNQNMLKISLDDVTSKAMKGDIHNISIKSSNSNKKYIQLQNKIRNSPPEKQNKFNKSSPKKYCHESKMSKSSKSNNENKRSSNYSFAESETQKKKIPSLTKDLENPYGSDFPYFGDSNEQTIKMSFIGQKET